MSSETEEIYSMINALYNMIPVGEREESPKAQKAPSVIFMLSSIKAFVQNKLELEKLLIKSEAELRNMISVNNQLNLDLQKIKGKYYELKKTKNELSKYCTETEKLNEENAQKIFGLKKKIEQLNKQNQQLKMMKKITVNYVEENSMRRNPLSKSTAIESTKPAKRIETRNLKQSFNFSPSGSERYFKENELYFTNSISK